MTRSTIGGPLRTAEYAVLAGRPAFRAEPTSAADLTRQIEDLWRRIEEHVRAGPQIQVERLA
jgi:hypothetical protein